MINATLSNNKLLPFVSVLLPPALLWILRVLRILRLLLPRISHCLPLTCLTYWRCVPGLAMRPTLRMSNANIPKIIKHRWLAFVVWFSALGLSSLGWFSCSWPQVVPLATGKPNRAACCTAGAEFEITLVYIVLRLRLKYCIKFAGWWLESNCT